MSEVIEVLNKLGPLKEEEAHSLAANAKLKSVSSGEIICTPGIVCHQAAIVTKGLLRVWTVTQNGIALTIHFAGENELIADFASLLQGSIAQHTIEAVEDGEVLFIEKPKTAWGKSYLKRGEPFERLISEQYFKFLDSRVNNLYSRGSVDRFNHMLERHPGILERADSAFIASYLGVSTGELNDMIEQSNK